MRSHLELSGLLKSVLLDCSEDIKVVEKLRRGM
jgi:hypothetical protein